MPLPPLPLTPLLMSFMDFMKRKRRIIDKILLVSETRFDRLDYLLTPTVIFFSADENSLLFYRYISEPVLLLVFML
jgi:hypothetical protein